MVDVSFLRILVDMGVICGLLKRKAGQLQDDGAPRKTEMDSRDRAKGKDMVIEIPIPDRSLEDLPEHLPAGRFAADLAPHEHHRPENRSSA